MYVPAVSLAGFPSSPVISGNSKSAFLNIAIIDDGADAKSLAAASSFSSLCDNVCSLFLLISLKYLL